MLLTREEFSQWLATVPPDRILGAGVFYLAFEAPAEEQASRLQELQTVAVNTHNLPLREVQAMTDTAFQWAENWALYASTVAEQLGFEPWEPFEGGSAEPLPPFPAEALPPVLREYALAVAESIQVPVDMAAVCLLAACALASQGAFEVEIKPDWREPLNLYMLIIADPSERKSPVLRETTRPIYVFEEAEQQRRAPAIQAYNIKKELLEKRLAAAKDRAAKPPKGKGEAGKAADLCGEEEVFSLQRELSELEPVKPFRLLADDVTSEALISLLAEYGGRFGVFSAEGGLFTVLSGLYSGKPNFDVFLKAFNGDPVRVDRKGRPSETIEAPVLTLLLMAQPQVLDDITASREFRGRGLLARFLYSRPVSRVGTRRYRTTPIPQAVRDEYAAQLSWLLEAQANHTGPAQIIRMSEDADALSSDFADRLEKRLPGDLADIGGWAGKFHGQICRIAAVLHCFNNGADAAETPLPGGTMQAAIRIGEYFLAHAQAALGCSGCAKSPLRRDSEYVWQAIRQSGADRLTKRELLRACRRLNDETIGPSLRELARRGYIKFETLRPAGSRGGRPSTVILVSPDAKLNDK